MKEIKNEHKIEKLGKRKKNQVRIKMKVKEWKITI